MPRLQALQLSRNALSSLGDLSKCADLRQLACHSCRLGAKTSLDALRANVRLEGLDLGDNSIGGTLPAFFASMTALKVGAALCLETCLLCCCCCSRLPSC